MESGGREDGGMEGGDVIGGEVVRGGMVGGGIDGGGVEMWRYGGLSSNPKLKKVRDPEFNSLPRQQTKRPKRWLSLTLKKTSVPNPNLLPQKSQWF